MIFLTRKWMYSIYLITSIRKLIFFKLIFTDNHYYKSPMLLL